MQQVIFYTILGFLLIIAVYVIICYREAQQVLRWHQQKHNAHAWASRAPRPSRWCALLNTLLFIQKTKA
jgi:hypothetical protein